MDPPSYTPLSPPPDTPPWLEADRQERSVAHFQRVQDLKRALKRVALGTVGLILLYVLVFSDLPYQAGDPRSFVPRIDPAIQQILLALILMPWAGVVGHLLILCYDFIAFEVLPVRCPHCGRMGNKQIARRAIPDTGREELVCSHCEHTWYQPLYVRYTGPV